MKFFLLSIFFSPLLFLNWSVNKVELSKENIEEPTVITRNIDVTKTFRNFPDLARYWNTSAQKAPAPILAKVAEESLGKAKITRCWLNLDEMWDYRTREYEFDFKMGVDKYKSIEEKHRESWDWQLESPSTFYKYMGAFSNSSDEIMLTIRRYERDILDKKLPISTEDWMLIFKTGLKHYKKLYPNIRYVEVGNEYGEKSFMNATDLEYYQFYKLGSQAVEEVNKELRLTGKDVILVGGPVVTGNILEKIDKFLHSYSEDTAPDKRVDFISWHEYHNNIKSSSDRQKDIESLLNKYNLPNNFLLFMTEHDPFHYKDDKLEYHFLNAAYLPRSLYYASLKSPDMKIFPWVLYHNKEIQTKFMWFTGPNFVNTKKEEIKMLPLGYSMKFLSMLKGKEIEVSNVIDGKDLVIATTEKNRVVIEVINYSGSRDVHVKIQNLNKIFPGFKKGKLKLKKFLIDSKHNNYLMDSSNTKGVEDGEEMAVSLKNGELILEHQKLEENGIVLWELVQ